MLKILIEKTLISCSKIQFSEDKNKFLIYDIQIIVKIGQLMLSADA